MEALVRHIDKGFVFLEGKACRAAKLIQAKRRHRTGEPVPGVESIGVAIPEQISVEIVGSTLQTDIDDGSAFDSELHARIRFHVEFGNSIQRNQCGGRTRDGRLAQRRLSIIAIIVGNPIDRKIIRRGALTVDVEALEPPARAALHARHSIEKIIKVAAVIGEILDFALHEERAETILGRFDQGSDILHFDGFRLRADLKGEVRLGHQGDINAGLTLHGLEPGSLHRQAVLSRVEIDDLKETGIIAGGGLFLPVPIFSARTTAPVTAAPLASLTVPEMSPVIFCPNRGMLAMKPVRRRTDTRRRRRSAAILPPSWPALNKVPRSQMA